ncbi:MAG: metal-binding protein [Cyanobium sp.]
MASGRQHDRATRLLALPFGLLWWPAQGPAVALTAAVSFLLGGLWLSPDLDTRSRATRRWGPLALLWWPYRRVLSHRSALSHSPLLGSAGRLAYLGAAIALISQALHPWGSPSAAQLLGGLERLWREQRPLLLAALVGLEASGWLHLIQDGDPVPRLPRPLRWLVRRQQDGRRSAGRRR